jgi:hypothetical protein
MHLAVPDYWQKNTQSDDTSDFMYRTSKSNLTATKLTSGKTPASHGAASAGGDTERY